MTAPETSAHDADVRVEREAADVDCSRCRGGGCEWCCNTGRKSVLMLASDADDLDAVVHILGIEDSEMTPAEAVTMLVADLHQQRATSQIRRNVAVMLCEQLEFKNGIRKRAWDGDYLSRLAAAVADCRPGCLTCGGTMLVSGCSPDPHIPAYPEACPDCDPLAPGFAPPCA